MTRASWSEVIIRAEAADMVGHPAGLEVERRREREGRAFGEIDVEIFGLGAPAIPERPLGAAAERPAQIRIGIVERDRDAAGGAASADGTLAVGEASGDIG